GTKVRVRRGSAGLAQVSPFRADQRYLSQIVSGKLRQRYAEDVNRPDRAETGNFGLGHPGQKDAKD
ncbi:hypothetical protein KI387_013220, partial [Taxus chinensis]